MSVMTEQKQDAVMKNHFKKQTVLHCITIFFEVLNANALHIKN